MKFSIIAILFLFLTCFAGAQPSSADSLLIISLQKDLSDNRHFSPEPQICWVKTKAGAEPQCLNSIDETKLLQTVRDKNVLVLIHGMGTRFSRAMRYYRHFSQHSLPYDLVIGIVWPGGTIKRSGLANGFLFAAASIRSKKAGKKLAPLLEAMAVEAGALDVYTHSLGAKTGLFSIKKLKTAAVRNLILTAPAISAKSLMPKKRFGFAGKSVTGKVAVFFSQNDPAFFFPAKRKMGRRGIIGPQSAYGKNFVNIDCTGEIQSHSRYWSSGTVVQFLKQEGIVRKPHLSGK